jgi:cytochrome c peroxidase
MPATLMKKQSAILLLVLATVGLLLWRQQPAPQAIAIDQDNAIARTDEPIDPLPRSVSLDDTKVSLGERLFNEAQLSHNNTISCASCHSLARGGADQLPKSVGINGQIGEINAPTVLNAGYNFKQFWDGRADSLEEQVNGPIQNPREMGSSWNEVVAKLNQSSEYVRQFAVSYPSGISPDSIKDAIATFERSLITPDSRFDLYLRGDEQALTDQEKHGYRLFKEYGCSTCHQGAAVGGNLFEKFGVMNSEGRGTSKADLGRFNVTGLEKDKYVFKVPSLRNVELTAPYFHDGSAADLEDAVRTMTKFQLGRSLSSNDLEDIVKFLKTLTGRMPAKQ